MKLNLKMKRSKVDARAEYNVTKKEFTVLKGSIISNTISHNERFNRNGAIERLREGIVDGNTLTKDVSFKSASSAANFVTGVSTNGLLAWRDSKGTSLKDILSSAEVKDE